MWLRTRTSHNQPRMIARIAKENLRTRQVRTRQSVRSPPPRSARRSLYKRPDLAAVGVNDAEAGRRSPPPLLTSGLAASFSRRSNRHRLRRLRLRAGVEAAVSCERLREVPLELFLVLRNLHERRDDGDLSVQMLVAGSAVRNWKCLCRRNARSVTGFSRRSCGKTPGGSCS